MFRAVRQMDRGGTRHYRLLAEILAKAFAAETDPAPKALAAGRAWGQQLEAERLPRTRPAPSRPSPSWSTCSTSSASHPSAG